MILWRIGKDKEIDLATNVWNKGYDKKIENINNHKKQRLGPLSEIVGSNHTCFGILTFYSWVLINYD